jgi:Bacterial sugar transferase
LSARVRRTLRAKPGLTGLCQIAFAKESELLDSEDAVGSYVERLLPAKVLIDVLYAERRSLRMDASILVWTVVAVVLRRDVAVNRASGRIGFRRRAVATFPADHEERSSQPVIATAGQAVD